MKKQKSAIHPTSIHTSSQISRERGTIYSMKLGSARENITWNLIVSPKKTIKRVTEGKSCALPYLLTITVLIGLYATVASTNGIVSFDSGATEIVILLVISGLLALGGLYIGAFFARMVAKLLFDGAGTMRKMVLGIGLGNIIILLPVLLYGLYFLITGNNPSAWNGEETQQNSIAGVANLIFLFWHLVVVTIAIAVVEKIQWWKAIITMMGVICLSVMLFIMLSLLFAVFLSYSLLN